MNGFKGFDKDMKCRGMQYAVGETATHKGTLSLCNSGLHFVENPIDIFSYYPPSDSRFAEVEADGVANAESDDTERVAKSLHIKAEVSLSAILGAGVKFILDKVDWKNAKESNTGNRSAATNTGKYGTAISLGIEGRASGSKGNFLVLAEWKYVDGEWKRTRLKSVEVDGKKIKADIFYTLKRGRFVPWKE